MKKSIAPLLVLFLCSFSLVGAKISEADRDKGVAELNRTHEFLINTVQGLSEAQLNFKSGPEAWSVAECVEHLTISENTFAQMLEGAIATPADKDMRAKVTMSDEDIMGMISSREKKVQTSESFVPSG